MELDITYYLLVFFIWLIMLQIVYDNIHICHKIHKIENHLFILVIDFTPHFPTLEIFSPVSLYNVSRGKFPFDVCLRGWRFSFSGYILLHRFTFSPFPAILVI